ncbi:MAG: hypothetical protein WBA54_02290, partial [Acidaminobacteraceae bacterium]
TYGRGNVVSPVSEIKATANNSKQLNPELIERIYDKLEILKEEYRAFYKEEQELESLLEGMCYNCDEFIGQLIKIFESYNKSIETLNDFDKAFRTNYIDTIKEVIFRYEDELSNINIFIEPDGKVRFYRNRLKKIFSDTPRKFDFVYKNDSNLIVKLYMAFHIIKAIVPEDASEQINKADNHGLLIDEKC